MAEVIRPISGNEALKSIGNEIRNRADAVVSFAAQGKDLFASRLRSSRAGLQSAGLALLLAACSPAENRQASTPAVDKPNIEYVRPELPAAAESYQVQSEPVVADSQEASPTAVPKAERSLTDGEKEFVNSASNFTRDVFGPDVNRDGVSLGEAGVKREGEVSKGDVRIGSNQEVAGIYAEAKEDDSHSWRSFKGKIPVSEAQKAVFSSRKDVINSPQDSKGFGELIKRTFPSGVNWIISRRNVVDESGLGEVNVMEARVQTGKLEGDKRVQRFASVNGFGEVSVVEVTYPRSEGFKRNMGFRADGTPNYSYPLISEERAKLEQDAELVGNAVKGLVNTEALKASGVDVDQRIEEIKKMSDRELVNWSQFESDDRGIEEYGQEQPFSFSLTEGITVGWIKDLKDGKIVDQRVNFSMDNQGGLVSPGPDMYDQRTKSGSDKAATMMGLPEKLKNLLLPPKGAKADYSPDKLRWEAQLGKSEVDPHRLEVFSMSTVPYYENASSNEAKIYEISVALGNEFHNVSVSRHDQGRGYAAKGKGPEQP